MADDAIFGRICLGGDWSATEEGVQVIPKDGLRKRFHALLGGCKLHLLLDNDRFFASEPIFLQDDFSEVRFILESDNPIKHAAKLRISGLRAGKYTIGDDNGTIATLDVQQGQEYSLALSMDGNTKSKRFSIARQAGQ